MEVLFILDITKIELEKEIDRYIENKDYETAKNLANSLGSEMKGFNVAKSIEKIEKAKQNEVK